MGALGTKEWREVYSTGSPGSPEADGDGSSSVAAGESTATGRRVTPEEAHRTPIRLSEAEETTDGGRSRIVDRLKRSLVADPRSPSGLPRTPILVQDDDVEEEEDQDKENEAAKAEETPKRGKTAERNPKRPPGPLGMTTMAEKNDCCRSPLLIESDDSEQVAVEMLKEIRIEEPANDDTLVI